MKEMTSVFLPDTDYGFTQTETKSEQMSNMHLAQAYVLSQPFETPSTPEQSLICGTAFSSLSMPYTGVFSTSQYAKEGQK